MRKRREIWRCAPTCAISSLPPQTIRQRSCGSNRKAEVAEIRKELLAICKPPEALFLEVT